VVSANGGKALNHFNKVHKGELLAALVADSPELVSLDDFVNWCDSVGITIRFSVDSIALVV
jgi:hypothetical protein